MKSLVYLSYLFCILSIASAEKLWAEIFLPNVHPSPRKVYFTLCDEPDPIGYEIPANEHYALVKLKGPSRITSVEVECDGTRHKGYISKWSDFSSSDRVATIIVRYPLKDAVKNPPKAKL